MDKTGAETFVEQVRSQFPFFESSSILYFDSAATSQKLGYGIDAELEYYQDYCSNIHRSAHGLAQKASSEVEKTRDTIANYLGCVREEVIFTSGTTQGLNMLALMLSKQLVKGDEIVLSIAEHHANLLSWQNIAKTTGCVLKFIPLTNDFQLDLMKAKELITVKTKIVSLCHISNVLGSVFDVESVFKIAKSVNAITIMDAAQSFGHRKLDITDCDFLVASAHKCFGSTGLGILYGKKYLLESLTPIFYGGGQVESVTIQTYVLSGLPYKFETGTLPIAQIIGFRKVLEYVQELGFENIVEYDEYLVNYFLNKLKNLNLISISVIGSESKESRVPIFTLSSNKLHTQDLAMLFDAQGVALREGRLCAEPLLNSLGYKSGLRVSLSMYTTREEIDTFFEIFNQFINKYQL